MIVIRGGVRGAGQFSGGNNSLKRAKSELTIIIQTPSRTESNLPRYEVAAVRLGF